MPVAIIPVRVVELTRVKPVTAVPFTVIPVVPKSNPVPVIVIVLPITPAISAKLVGEAII